MKLYYMQLCVCELYCVYSVYCVYIILYAMKPRIIVYYIVCCVSSGASSWAIAIHERFSASAASFSRAIIFSIFSPSDARDWVVCLAMVRGPNLRRGRCRAVSGIFVRGRSLLSQWCCGAGSGCMCGT